MGKKVWRALAALILSAALLCGTIGGAVPAAAAGTKTLQVGIISDLHALPAGESDHRGEALESALAALAAHAKQNGMKYVLVPGDTSRDGELSAHKLLAERLVRFEKETGLQVAVVPGNHDIHNAGGEERTTPEQFREIYKALGFDLPNASYYKPPAGKKGGMLSYAADIGDGFRLIAMDVCKYSADQNPDGTDSYATGGMISGTMMDWVLEECAKAKKAGKTIIGMMHHSLTPHTGPQEYILLDFMLDDWLRVRETLADAGMHYVITGHMHIDEIGYGVSDSGAVIYDICTASLADFPCRFREVKFTAAGANDITADVKSFEADCVKPVADGKGGVYPSPFSVPSYALGYGGNGEGIQGFLTGMLGSMLGGMLKDMSANGGVASMLGDSFDLAGMLGGVPGLGLIEKNIMGLVNDIFRQIDKLYIGDSDRTIQLVSDVVDKLLGMQVSQYPSTRFIEPFGMGDKNRPGTLGDLANEGVLYCYGRFTGADQNKFVTDALNGFEHGDNVQKLFNLLLDIVLHDLLEDEFLKNLHLNLAPVFVRPVIRLTLGSLLDGFLRLLLLGDNSFQAVVDLVFNINDLINLVPYSGIEDAVDSLLADFWTESQDEALGYQIAYLVRRFFYPQNELPDLNAVLRYTGPRKVTPTAEDLRLPSMLSQALPAAGAETTRTVSWFTKDSVKGTDIRVWDKNGGEITKRLKLSKSTEAVKREFPGVDLGIIGLIEAPVYLTRHTVTISGLEPGRTYTYQVGDAGRGWWSEKGVIRTAMDPRYQYTQFLSFTDQQAQTPLQYQRSWGKLSAKALELYPAARLIVSGGDQVDGALNLHQWQWFLDSGKDALLRLPLMAINGNHEDSGAALAQYLPLGGELPARNEDDGIYYAFDYNNIHFIMLNTNDLDGDVLSAAQVEWLRKDAQASEADWKIVVLHKSMYSNGSHYKDADVIGLREQLSALFPALGVDLVISGHDHTYLRTEAQGVKYVIAGTSGVKYYNVTAPEETDKYFPRAQALADAQAPVFAAYTTAGNELRYEAWLMNGSGKLEKIDEFSIVKPEIEVIPLDTWDFPEDDGLPVYTPKTGDSTVIVLIPLSLMMAAELAMWMIRRKERESLA